MGFCFWPGVSSTLGRDYTQFVCSTVLDEIALKLLKLVAGTLLPDILSFDRKRPASFPNNCRTVSDDVVDVFLPILTNRRVAGDKVGPHSDLLGAFPYLGSPQKARSAELVAA
jgi:hypothetical protein